MFVKHGGPTKNRNVVPTILSLPPELLCRIYDFYFFKDVDQPVPRFRSDLILQQRPKFFRHDDLLSANKTVYQEANPIADSAQRAQMAKKHQVYYIVPSSTGTLQWEIQA